MKFDESTTGCGGSLWKWGRRPTASDRKFKARDYAPTSSDPKLGSSSNRDLRRLEATENLSSCVHYGSSCDFSVNEKSPSPRTQKPQWLSPERPPAYSAAIFGSDIRRPEITKTIEAKIDELNPFLRKLSLQIHDHPEIGFKEKYAHDTLTAVMVSHGFSVTRHYLGLETAWRAEFEVGNGGRVLGVNSEMDALPGIGHACGHNLIAVAGVGVAIALKTALHAHNISGKVVLLGTPAEEGGGGKSILLERGGYADMDACVMCHPAPGDSSSAGIASTLALQNISVEYFGQTAHAGAAPWEGINALDAAFLAYSGVSVLRQQTKPDHRVHGIIEGKDWTPNVIPDYAKMRWIVRAPTWPELVILQDRLTACLEGAAHATSCKYKIEFGSAPYYDLRQNSALAQEFAGIIGDRYNMETQFSDGAQASTDFGNVSYKLPSLHPMFTIPSPGGGNHTPAFADAARTIEAHETCITIMKGLAISSLRLLTDEKFFNQVKKAFHDGQEGANT